MPPNQLVPQPYCKTILQKVQSKFGDRLILLDEIGGGNKTAVFSAKLKVGEEELPVVLKCWREGPILTSQALTTHDNYLALNLIMRSGALLDAIKVPVFYGSYAETESGLIVSLPVNQYVLNRPGSAHGAINNQLVIVQDIRYVDGLKYPLRDLMENVPVENKGAIHNDLKFIAGLIHNCEPDLVNSVDIELVNSVITVMAPIPVTFIADIDGIKPIPHSTPSTIDFIDLIRQTDGRTHTKDRQLEKPDVRH